MKIEISEETFDTVYDVLLDHIAETEFVYKGRERLTNLDSDRKAMNELIEIDKRLNPSRWAWIKMKEKRDAEN